MEVNATAGPITIGTLHTALRVTLYSIEQLSANYAHWSSLAPGLVHGPPPPSPLSGSPSPNLDVPIIGDVWNEIREDHSSRHRAEGIKGLRCLRLSIKRELEYLEKFALDRYLEMHESLPPMPATDPSDILFSSSQRGDDAIPGNNDAAPPPLDTYLTGIEAPASSNAPSLCAHWEHLLFPALTSGCLSELGATLPVRVSEGKQLKGKKARQAAKNSKQQGKDSTIAKVDAIYNQQFAPVGLIRQRWVKIVTIKESALLSEFRLWESYIEPDDGSDQEVEKRRGEEAELDIALCNCSLYKLICELSAAADVRAATSLRPFVEIILSRLPIPPLGRKASMEPEALSPQQVYALPEAERYTHRLTRLQMMAQELGIELVSGFEREARLRMLQQQQSMAKEVFLPSDIAYGKYGADVLRNPGFNIALAILPGVPLRPPLSSLRTFHPTRRINLDLSALVALVSDVSHMPLAPDLFSPDSDAVRHADANPNESGHVEQRFLDAFKRAPPWKDRGAEAQRLRLTQQLPHIAHQEGAELLSASGADTSRSSKSGLRGNTTSVFPKGKGAAGHDQGGLTQGRALALQLKREVAMASSGTAFIRSLIDSTLHGNGGQVQLCTTAAAKQKFQDILEFVAGPKEKQRALALFGSSSEDFDLLWADSRFKNDHQLRSRLRLPVEVIDDAVPSAITTLPPSAFVQTAIEILSSALATETSSSKVAPVPHNVSTSVSAARKANAQVSSSAYKQTPHTLHSMLMGFSLGITTLTTNVASVRWLLRELSHAYGGFGSSLLSSAHSRSSADPGLLWVTYPRSLAENMRADADDRTAQCANEQGKLAVQDCILPSLPRQAQGNSPSSSSADEKERILSSSAGSHRNEHHIPPTSSALTTRFPYTATQGSGRRGIGSRVVQFVRGPARPAKMTIRHYPWWPLSKVEAAWLHFTLHVRWKDLEDPSSWKSSRGDVSTLELSQPCAAELSRDHAKGESLLLTEEDADGHGPVWWATAVKRDIKHNFAHWLIFVLTCIGWIFGFSFLSKSLWYSSAANIGGEKNQSDLQFYGCTTTYWLRNADCGLDGQSCVPFASNVSVPFRCPNGCSSTTLGAARAVGAEIINWKPLIVGGGDVQQTYRADSWVCASAIHAGLFSDLKGGCGVLSLVGTYSDYEAKVANGLGSLSFNSTFPSSYRLERMDNGTGCSDDRWKGYFLNVVLSSFVGFVLQPKPIVFFWLLVCLGFWHVNMISEPRDFPPPIGVPFGDFLPTLFTAYAIWKLAVRFVWPAFNRLPIERTIWQLGFYWLGTLLNVVFASVPLNRLVASDLRSQPGALTSLIIIIIVVVIIVINQLRVVRKTGYLPKYLTLYITGGIIVGILAAVPGESLRLHHYIISLVLLPGAAFPTRLCLIYSSFLLGMFLNGVGRWGFDGLLQDVATVRGDGIISSDLPSFATQQATWAGVVANSTNTTASRGTVTWTPIPVNLTSSWDSFALLVDDVLRYQGTATSFNISSILSDYESDAAKNLTNSLNDVSVVSLSQQLASEPHYLRLAYVSQGQYGDFTQAATAFYNGTWIDAPPGAT